MAGRLYVVATPIGNLEDITLRALRILGEVATIACEDTRQTVKILNRYGIRKPLISYFHPHEGRSIPEIIASAQGRPGRRPGFGRRDAGNLRPGIPSHPRSPQGGHPRHPHPRAVGRGGRPVRRGPAHPPFPFRRFPAPEERPDCASSSKAWPAKKPRSSSTFQRGGSANSWRPSSGASATGVSSSPGS